ncbi:hypothetical protein FSP39_020357 [Pinctada imbricata]|uniref:chitin synthase n=1 Tax=Pinctada imbricata TaxID=66713 RepID=A0AA88Y1B0_PINIB|nr:hypothetical protein FSP39_020357 [Pinctada imbricata]
MASTSQQSGSHMKEKGNPLAVTGKAKLDRFNERKESLNKRPSTLLVISKWMVTGVFGLLLLFCLSFNKLSIVATGRWHLKKDGDHDPQRIVMLFTIIIIPYAITFLRSVWVTIGRKDLPRPKTSAIIYCIVASLLEVIGITLVACEVIVGEKAYIPVLLMNVVLLLPLSSLTAQNWRNKSWRLILSTIFSLLGTTATIVLLFLGNPDIKNTVILLVGIFLVSISWMPWLQEKMMEIKIEQPIQEIPEEIPKGSFRLEQFAQNNRVTDLRAMQISENNSHWRSLRISSFIKLISTLPAILIYEGISGRNFSNVFSDFKDGWSSSDWSPNAMLLWFFVSNVLTAVLGYMVAVFACRTCMDRGAFVLPLFLSTPLTVALLTVYGPCSVLLDHVDKSTNCGNPTDVKTIALIAASVLCFAVSQALSVGFNAFKGSSIILEKETKLFRFASFNGVFLEQWLLVDKRQDFEGLDRNAQQSQHKKSKVFICTTMYNENQTEMKQLLESVYAVNAAQISGDQTSCHFESHIFLDGSIRDDDLQENALRLLSLLPESLGIVDLRKGTKIITPYGMAISWKLPTPNGLNGMNFTIHFKDIRKVKNKKRWSQIMYISYVLDFLNKNFKQGTDSSSEDDSFILTTDADVRFEATDVETLLDLMTRDHTVGAVCARTYPLGSGPLVWYQKFEYAIGHWFQKAAEHVLGSVLCAPGCFSVYRCSALRDIVPIYATGVKKAFDFLIKDMGEDRWLCTLMTTMDCIDNGKYLEADRMNGHLSTGMNHKVSILFCMYQIFLFASTIVGPSGLVYAWGANLVVTMVLQIIVCLLFSLACMKLKSSQQLMNPDTGETYDYPDYPDEPTVSTKKPDAISIHIPYSVTTVYLTALASLFFVTGLLHFKEVINLLYGLIYLLCLPSCYLILLIYTICNITDRSWGETIVLLYILVDTFMYEDMTLLFFKSVNIRQRKKSKSDSK